LTSRPIAPGSNRESWDFDESEQDFGEDKEDFGEKRNLPKPHASPRDFASFGG
jgi:hypothetical protein